MDLLSEIDFAKKYFDFIEITLKKDLSEYKPKYITRLSATLKDFEVLGHLHWELNLSKEIYKHIRIFKELGAKKITIHLKQNNLSVLIKIVNFCRKNRLQLLVENSGGSFFGRTSDFKKLLNNIPCLGITLDIGHASLVSKLEINGFLKLKNRIKHIHLHNVSKRFDHLPFRNKAELKQLINKIKDTGYDETITLEIFYILKNNKYIPIDGKKRRRLLLKQLELIKNLNR